MDQTKGKKFYIKKHVETYSTNINVNTTTQDNKTLTTKECLPQPIIANHKSTDESSYEIPKFTASITNFLSTQRDSHSSAVN